MLSSTIWGHFKMIKEALLFLCLEYTLLLDVSLEVGQTELKNLLPLIIYFSTDCFTIPSLCFAISIQVSITVKYLTTSASIFLDFELAQIFSCISCIQICHIDFIFVYWRMISLKSPKQTLDVLWWSAGMSFIMKFALERRDEKHVFSLPGEKQQRPWNISPLMPKYLGT